MGYECPVCGSEEADGEHLANHLAFTALARGGDHEAWLDDRVPDWAERGPEGLASEVVEHATETDTEPTTTGREREQDHDRSHDQDVPVDDPEAVAGRTGRTARSEETADVLEEARELTAEMYAAEGDASEGDEAEAGRADADGANERGADGSGADVDEPNETDADEPNETDADEPNETDIDEPNEADGSDDAPDSESE